MDLNTRIDENIDFRKPQAIEGAQDEATVKCRAYGGNSKECRIARDIAYLATMANHCYYGWNPECIPRLTGRMNIVKGCRDGLYKASPQFQDAFCGSNTDTNQDSTIQGSLYPETVQEIISNAQIPSRVVKEVNAVYVEPPKKCPLTVIVCIALIIIILYLLLSKKK